MPLERAGEGVGKHHLLSVLSRLQSGVEGMTLILFPVLYDHDEE